MRKKLAVALMFAACGCSQNNFSDIIDAHQTEQVVIKDRSDVIDGIKDAQAKIDSGKLLTIEEFEAAYRNSLALQESEDTEHQKLGQEMQKKLVNKGHELDETNNTLMACMGILLAIFPMLMIITLLVV